MGTWGTAIFSDDLASDIKGGWKDLIGEGLSPEKATTQIMKDYSSALNDSDEISVFWLALAASQWQTGRLLDNVKAKAIEIIDSKENLKRWELDADASTEIKKREKVLLRLREQLLSEQPKAKKISKPFRENSTFNKGDIFSYRHDSGKLALFRVIGIHEDKGGRFSVCELLNWFNEKLPEKKGKTDKKSISKIPITNLKSIGYGKVTKFMLGETVNKYAIKPEKIELISKKNKPIQDSTSYRVLLWRDLEKYLTETFENQ